MSALLCITITLLDKGILKRYESFLKKIKLSMAMWACGT